PQRPHRRLVARRGRTWTTTVSDSSSRSISSITVARSTPTTRRHTLAPSTPSSLPCLRTFEQSENVGGGWRCSRQGVVTAPTDVSVEPELIGGPMIIGLLLYFPRSTHVPGLHVRTT